MSRTRWLSPLALLATAALIVTACGSTAATASPAAPSVAAPSVAAPSVAAPSAVASAPANFTPTSYPATAVDCKNKPANYTGEFSQIKAIDATTVEFDLCAPDVAFLSKIAFSPFAIQSTAYLTAHAADGSIVQQPNGTGPYMVKEWVKGDHITLVANPNYWGPNKPKVPTMIFQWSSEAAQRLVQLQSGAVDGIDNVGSTDFDTVSGDSNLKLIPREALNVFYVGFNNTFKPFDNEKVRQAIAMGIDRDRIVKNFYPAGSEVAKYFTPCAIKYGCTGDEWYSFDAAAAKKLLAEAGFPNGFSTTIHLRDVTRGYLPNPTQVAQDIQAQLKANLNIDAKISVEESTTFIDNTTAGKTDGIHLLGWGADYPDITDFLDYHLGSGATPQFGKKYDDIVAALKTGSSTADDAARTAAYTEANNLLKQHVPMIPVAHGGSAVAFKADVDGAHASPLTSEYFAVMKPGDRQQLVFLQQGEPGGLYCADETDGESLRVCEQVGESLYSYKIGGTDVEPNLAKQCTPNADLTVWTCQLQAGVKFANGDELTANDVVTTYAAQWDTQNPLHKGRTGDFAYFSTLFGGFLNPPAQ